MDDIEPAKGRIERDIRMFNENVRQVEITPDNSSVVELAKMYASDAKSYLGKGDFYTAFSCISYAHGLIDALREFAKHRR